MTPDITSTRPTRTDYRLIRDNGANWIGAFVVCSSFHTSEGERHVRCVTHTRASAMLQSAGDKDRAIYRKTRRGWLKVEDQG